MKRRIAAFTQLLLGMLILGWVFRQLHRTGQLGKLSQALANAAGNWPYLVLAVLGFGFTLLLCTVRWNLLLKSQGVRMPFPRVGALYLVGQFFNAFLFGATGGDVVKAYYVATETRRQRAEVVATVFLDRFIGMLALLLLAFVVTTARFPYLWGTRATRIVMLLNYILVAGIMATIFILFRLNLLERIPYLRRHREDIRVVRALSRAYAAFELCMRERGLLTRTMLLSLFNHVAACGIAFCFGKALGSDMRFMVYLTVFPLVSILSSIPITPGGLGTRETASLLLLGAVGMGEAMAVTLSLFTYAGTLVWSLIGGVVYFFYVARRQLPNDAGSAVPGSL